jgi:hypothetical protein
MLDITITIYNGKTLKIMGIFAYTPSMYHTTFTAYQLLLSSSSSSSSSSAAAKELILFALRLYLQ